jgi:beta-glucosidase
MNKLYGNLTNEVSERERTNTALAREAAREGFVLLKNDKALPLKNKKIALYGMGARKTIKGGTGSGEVSERHSVSIDEGLRNAGYTITTEKYLNDYDVLFDTAYKNWHDDIDDKLAGQEVMKIFGQFDILGGFQWPAGRLITEDDITESATDAAIYVIARQAGEDTDRALKAGDWYLSETEIANLKFVAERYHNTIAVINVGGQIDLSFVDEIDGINALVFFVQGGMSGGDALADVLSGRYSFSGKLVDTWAKKYEDIPFAMDYARLNGDLESEYYKEGIYVGYRYFDAFEVEPRYPFGFGLSYTDFSIEVIGITLSKTRVTVTVSVTNTGKTHAGKEVVQAYISAPGGKLVKEAQRLVAFVKTGELQPGASQTLDMIFDMTELASYYERDSAWILESGEYVLKIGNSSRHTTPAAVITLSSEVVTQKCRRCCAPVMPVEEITAPVVKTVIADEVLRFTLAPDDFTTVTYEYGEPFFEEDAREKTLLDQFTTEQLISLIIGGDLQSRGAHIHGALGTTGRTSLILGEYGVGNVVVCDGPAGLNIINHTVLGEDGTEKSAFIPQKYDFKALRMILGSTIGTEGTHIYRYATAWPVELLIAQTWNLDIAERIGKGMGTELEEFGVTLLLAPGMNIHRNPLCGRTFEYFSEDPLLTGKMAAAVIKGVQSFPGIGLTPKHFCCNNQEDNRSLNSSNVNERALREIYLKGFEIAVRESKPLSLMTSYNRVNGVYTANRYDLLTDILRCEWGFNGLVMTDWNSCSPGHGDAGKAAPAGNDLIMPGSTKEKDRIAEAVNTSELPYKTLRKSACRVLRVILQSEIYSKN